VSAEGVENMPTPDAAALLLQPEERKEECGRERFELDACHVIDSCVAAGEALKYIKKSDANMIENAQCWRVDSGRLQEWVSNFSPTARQSVTACEGPEGELESYHQRLQGKSSARSLRRQAAWKARSSACASGVFRFCG